MKRLKSFINSVDIVRWLKLKKILNVFVNFADSIMRLSIGQSLVILLILLVREVYFKDAVTVEYITASVYIFLCSISSRVSSNCSLDEESRDFESHFSYFEDDF